MEKHPDDNTALVEVMRQKLLLDIYNSLNIRHHGITAKAIKIAIAQPALKFCRHLIRVDQLLAAGDFNGALTYALSLFSLGVDHTATAEIPRQGPLLAVANHAGAVDFLAAIACLGRQDIHIVAGARPLLDHLPQFQKLLLPLDRNALNRMGVTRQIIALLQKGEAILLFPRGILEMDPAMALPESIASIAAWSDSVGLFLKKVPETILQPMVISNALSPTIWKNFITGLGKTTKQKLQISMIQQMALPFLSSRFDHVKMKINVFSGQPLLPVSLSPTLDHRELNHAVRQHMKAVIRQTMTTPA